MTALCTSSREIPGLLLLRPVLYRDGRGVLFEIFNRHAYERAGICDLFVQDNVSRSGKNVVRGLHFQREKPQAKLITCIRGEVFDVALDLRPGSASFGRWDAVRLSADRGEQAYLPAGFAHGFAALSDPAVVLYKCSEAYDPEDQHGVNPLDPELAIPWPVARPLLSERDRNLPGLEQMKKALKHPAR